MVCMGAPQKPRPLSIHHIMWFGENWKTQFTIASSEFQKGRAL
jgi:hypothetical protein